MNNLPLQPHEKYDEDVYRIWTDIEKGDLTSACELMIRFSILGRDIDNKFLFDLFENNNKHFYSIAKDMCSDSLHDEILLSDESIIVNAINSSGQYIYGCKYKKDMKFLLPLITRNIKWFVKWYLKSIYPIKDNFIVFGKLISSVLTAYINKNSDKEFLKEWKKRIDEKIRDNMSSKIFFN